MEGLKPLTKFTHCVWSWPHKISAQGSSELDICTTLVQIGAMTPTQQSNPKRKRFSIALDAADYHALQQLAAAQRPPLKQQYLIELAVKNLLDQYENRQLSFPLERSNA